MANQSMFIGGTSRLTKLHLEFTKTKVIRES